MFLDKSEMLWGRSNCSVMLDSNLHHANLIGDYFIEGYVQNTDPDVIYHRQGQSMLNIDGMDSTARFLEVDGSYHQHTIVSSSPYPMILR